MLQELLEEQLIELDEEWLHDELDEHDNDEEDETELEQLKKKNCCKAVIQVKNFTRTLKNMNRMRRKNSSRKSWTIHWMKLKKIQMMMMSRNL